MCYFRTNGVILVDNLRLFVGITLSEIVIERLTVVLGRMKTELPFRKWTHPADLHITLHFLGDTREDQLSALRAAMAAAAAATDPMGLALTAPGTFGPPHAPRILWLGVAEPSGTGSGATGQSVASPDTPAAIVTGQSGGSAKAAGTDGSGEGGGSGGSGGSGEFGEPGDFGRFERSGEHDEAGKACEPRRLRQLHAALAPGLSAAGFALDERPFRPHLTLARQSGAGCDEKTIRAVWQESVAMTFDGDESESFAWTADRLTLFRSHLGRRPSYERLEEWQFRAL